MNSVADEIKSYSGISSFEGTDDEFLEHYGMPRRSGRYPWGSGDDPYQHGRDFIGRIEQLKKEGWTETPENIMKEFGLTTTQYRSQKAIAKSERRSLDVARAKSLKEDGLNTSQIAREMGVRESTVRSWFNSESETRMNKAKETASSLKKIIDEKGLVDIGVNVERELNMSREKFNQSIALLEEEGYVVVRGRMPQVTNPGKHTTLKVIGPPGTPYRVNEKGEKVSSVAYDYENIQSLKDYISRDGGSTLEKKFHYPESLDSSRLMIRYKEDGGIDKDGVVELRRGVADLSLGESRYSQVRILVDGTHYIKGMAVYSDDMPDGVDVVFNTNKTKDKSKMEVLKPIKSDPDNPFGSAIKDAEQGGQYWYTDKNGERKLGLINKRADEGDWTEWKNAVPSQFLSKQSQSLAKKQLDIAKADKKAEYDEICALNNPTIKKHYLEKFAEECDSAAVHLQAAALPGQRYHVIIPVNTLKDNEIYAPNYDNGTKLALVRYPHGGTFEIPVLTVNNKHAEAKKLLGTDIVDAVGINKNVADRLSGADFDGDTVMCIPTHDRGGKVKVVSTPALKGLEGFDPKDSYSGKKVVADDGTEHYYRNGKEYHIMKDTQKQMGVISNLITDMTLLGAKDDELAAAVRHSMVVIDAEKHKLDYKQSELDNNIAALKKTYQRGVDADGNVKIGGASTLLSRSKGEESVLKRQGTPNINQKGKEWYDPTRPEGALIYKTADDVDYTITKVNKRTGEVVTTTHQRTQRSTKMAETDDARTLISTADTPMERLYADYANSMKALANSARLEMLATGNLKTNPSAKETYKKEVASLKSKLNDALLNSPRERLAQVKANAEIEAKKKAYYEEHGTKMKPADVKKISQQAISKYREEVGAVKRRDRSIKITDKEWEAIQAGAVSEKTLSDILSNADADALRARATPRSSTTISAAKISQMRAMSGSYTLSEIAKKFGVSTSTVSKYLKGAE